MDEGLEVRQPALIILLLDPPRQLDTFEDADTRVIRRAGRRFDRRLLDC